MKRIILAVAILAMAAVPAGISLAEPESASPKAGETSPAGEPNMPAQTTEERMAAMEARIDTLEQQVKQLTDRLSELEDSPRRSSTARSENEPNRDVLRIERTGKQIKIARDAIELVKSKIVNLPQMHNKSTEEKLEIVKNKWQLLTEIERNLSKIISLAERNPELGIDVIAVKRELDECQGDKKEAEMKKQALREAINSKKAKDSEPVRKKGAVTK